MNAIIKAIQINIPFHMLREGYLPRFVELGINPEIGFDADALDRFTPTDFEPVAQRLRAAELSVTLHGPFIDLSPGSPDPAIGRVTRHRFEQVLGAVAFFRPRSVV
ncbi:MAG: sugar phosphate isomerase/epimerase, partial [Deltaproteobacteria bacterium]|nr:sugar phosphate isomerase/epimerase [Deltaproteobacteria bacterium]